VVNFFPSNYVDFLPMPNSQTQTQSQSISCPLPQTETKEAYHELLDTQGQFRPHWNKVLPYLRPEGLDELNDYWQQAERILRDNGVAYHVYDDPQGMLRPWILDAIPLCLSAKEWQHIERSIIQRARLLNALLEDFYGPQELLQKNLLPSSLVLAHPNYLRPCHGLPVPRNIRLHLYAVDLARSPDGTWWVLGDRTQAPSGAGYALENRIVMSRVLPEAFHDGKIERLAHFFRSTQSMLASLSPRRDQAPRIVILTPGPYNETYFEHAYLARYLGYSLVEGSDLIVRDHHVYLKTLGGLRQVDVILRRVDDHYCDPLELRSDSLLGIPGLVEAVRCGNVALANSLGSSLVQTPALTGFLPGLCQHVLGEELHMPSVATWWCGEAPARAYVKENLQRLVLRPTFPEANAFPIFGDQLNAQERAELLDKIDAQPHAFVAQEQVRLSEAPAYLGQRLESRSILVRVFVSADGEGNYTVMPGGLTRVANSETSHTVSMQQGGSSKDTWIEATIYREHHSLLPQQSSLSLQRGTYDLPSRVADNLFWLGRYAERSESTARLFRSMVNRLTLEQGREEMDSVLPVLKTLVAFDQLSDLPDLPLSRTEVETLLIQDLLNPLQPGSLLSTIYRLHGIAATVRDRISTDTWRILNQLKEHLEKEAQRKEPQLTDHLLTLNHVILSLSAFNGMTSENMTQNMGWRFLQLGRKLERVLYSTRVLRESLHGHPESVSSRLELLLEIFDCIITYRQKYFSLQAHSVFDLIFIDGENPRSLTSQIRDAVGHLQELSPQNKNSVPHAEEAILSRAFQQIQILDFTQEGKVPALTSLQQLLEQVENALSECSNLLSLRYFNHLRPSQAGQGENLQREHL
jgi:uncharacterized circularly permuted ATP-grasp superfamily protein/uncharacterized alpha-E superfamily protein